MCNICNCALLLQPIIMLTLKYSTTDSKSLEFWLFFWRCISFQTWHQHFPKVMPDESMPWTVKETLWLMTGVTFFFSLIYENLFPSRTSLSVMRELLKTSSLPSFRGHAALAGWRGGVVRMEVKQCCIVDQGLTSLNIFHCLQEFCYSPFYTENKSLLVSADTS